MPEVSIIVAVYNVEPYLRRSMDCLMNQTMKDLEFICIDDCSTDGSLAILKEYAEKDSRFKIIESQQNGGAAVARNKGLEVAKGKYLGFIDPDDAIDLNYYEELYNKAKEGDYDIVKCYRKNIFPNGDVMLGKVSKNIKEHGLYYFGAEWTTAIYKSSIIFKNGIKFPAQIRKGQDVVFLNNIILNSKSIALIDNVYYYYYKRNDSLNAENLSLEAVKSACCAYNMMLENTNKSNLFFDDKETYIKYYERILHNIIYTLISRNQTKEARAICAETVISNFHKCKDINELKKKYRHKSFLKYIEKEDIKNLAKFLEKYKNEKDYLSNYSFLENLFSIKNTKKHKVLTIFGIKLKHKSRRYEVRKKINSIKSIINEQNIVIDEQKNSIYKLIKLTNEQQERIDKLKEKYLEQIEKQKEAFKKISIWQNNFNKDIPKEYPAELTEDEKELIIKYFKDSKKYLEFGSGGSTFISLLNSKCSVDSVESDYDWLEHLRTYKFIRDNENNRLNFVHIDIGKTKEWGRPVDDSKKENYPDYSAKVFKTTDSKEYDLVFVDGRFRVACVLGIILNCEPDIKIMIHDYPEREYYHVIEEFLDLIEVKDTLAVFKIKENIDTDRVKTLYEEYKYNFE